MVTTRTHIIIFEVMNDKLLQKWTTTKIWKAHFKPLPYDHDWNNWNIPAIREIPSRTLNIICPVGTEVPIYFSEKKRKTWGKSLVSYQSIYIYNACRLYIPTQFMHFNNLNAGMSFKRDLYSSIENNDLRKNTFKFTIKFAYTFTKGKLVFSSGT